MKKGHYVYNNFIRKENKWVTIDDDKILLTGVKKRNEQGTLFILKKVTNQVINEVQRENEDRRNCENHKNFLRLSKSKVIPRQKPGNENCPHQNKIATQDNLGHLETAPPENGTEVAAMAKEAGPVEGLLADCNYQIYNSDMGKSQVEPDHGSPPSNTEVAAMAKEAGPVEGLLADYQIYNSDDMGKSLVEPDHGSPPSNTEVTAMVKEAATVVTEAPEADAAKQDDQNVPVKPIVSGEIEDYEELDEDDTDYFDQLTVTTKIIYNSKYQKQICNYPSPSHAQFNTPVSASSQVAANQTNMEDKDPTLNKPSTAHKTSDNQECESRCVTTKSTTSTTDCMNGHHDKGNYNSSELPSENPEDCLNAYTLKYTEQSANERYRAMDHEEKMNKKNNIIIHGLEEQGEANDVNQIVNLINEIGNCDFTKLSDVAELVTIMTNRGL